MSTLGTQAAWQAYLGLDVAKDKLDVVLHRGSQKSHRVFLNTAAGFQQLHAWMSGVPSSQVLVCLEATGSYSDGIAAFLVEQGYGTALLNPAVLVNYRKSENIRSKTDKLDAELLARYAQQHQPRLWRPLPQPVQSLRRLLEYRTDVLRMQQQERNRLHAGRLTDWTRAQVQEHVQILQRQLKAAEKQIKTFLKSQTDLCALWERLQSIPGIGWLSAALLIALIGDIGRFQRVGALVSLAGLALVERESGTSVHAHPHIDRHGYPQLRQVLYWAAIAALRTDAQMQAWAARLRERGKAGKVVLVAVMRKLLHIVYGVWKTQTDYDAGKVLGPVA
jgi:transposase